MKRHTTESALALVPLCIALACAGIMGWQAFTTDDADGILVGAAQLEQALTLDSVERAERAARAAKDAEEASR